jgi:hypothetical protein
VLQQVYIDDRNIDEDLVESIAQPANDKNAAEVFFRIITGKGTPVNFLLEQLDKACTWTLTSPCFYSVVYL